MRNIDYFICLLMAIVMIVGGYQFYFLVQRHHRGVSRQYTTSIDEWIPLQAWWVWIYSGLYYPMILLLVFRMKSYEMFAYTAFSFLVLLTMQVAVFYFYPVRIPDDWRAYDVKASMSHRALAFVQSYDSVSNSIPSMHVSVATLTALHLHASLAAGYGDWALAAFLFPVVIAISALFTKQHYIADLPPGAMFGWFAYWATHAMLTA